MGAHAAYTGDVVWADRPHSVCGDCVLAVSWNYALPGRLPAYMRRDLEAAAQLRRSPGGDQVAWGQEQRAFCLGHPLLLAVTQDRGWVDGRVCVGLFLCYICVCTHTCTHTCTHKHTQLMPT